MFVLKNAMKRSPGDENNIWQYTVSTRSIQVRRTDGGQKCRSIDHACVQCVVNQNSIQVGNGKNKNRCITMLSSFGSLQVACSIMSAPKRSAAVLMNSIFRNFTNVMTRRYKQTPECVT